MVYPVSTGDGWARISTIKMLSYPTGQGQAWGRIRRGMKRVARTGGWCPDLKVTGKWNARGCIVSHMVYLWDDSSDGGGGDDSVRGMSVLLRITGNTGTWLDPARLSWCWVTFYPISLEAITHAARPHKYDARNRPQYSGQRRWDASVKVPPPLISREIMDIGFDRMDRPLVT